MIISLWTISAGFLILIGVNVCIYIGKKAYRTHVLLKNTISYVLLQYGVGVLVIYLMYLEVMSALGVDARPSITRELIMWSVLTLATASISYLISRLAVSPSDGILYHMHNVLLHRIVDGNRPEAWRSTMRQFEVELSKATKYQVYGHMLPRFLQFNSASEPKVQPDTGSEVSLRSKSSSHGMNSKIALLRPATFAVYGTIVKVAPMVVTTVTTTLKHWWIRLSGIKITLGSVDEYYKDGNGGKLARIPNKSVSSLMIKSKNQLNLDEFNSLTTLTSDSDFQ